MDSGDDERDGLTTWQVDEEVNQDANEAGGIILEVEVDSKDSWHQISYMIYHVKYLKQIIL